MTLTEKVAVVTGGSEGLGLAIVKELLASGCTVHTIARNQEKLNSAKAEINNPNFFIHAGDVSDFNSIEKIATEINSCDILINNAGIWTQGTLAETSSEDISKVINTNLGGVINVTKAFLPAMQKADQGFILNISSTSGLKARLNQSVYAASKWGVTGFTESLKEDLKSSKIKVTGFYPGGMNTGIFATAGFATDTKTWMDPSKVATVVTFMLSLDDSMILDHVVLNRRTTK